MTVQENTIELMRRSPLLLIACCFICRSLWAQTSPTPWHVTISIEVGADEPLKARITSYLTRELRSIPGITIGDTHVDYGIEVVAVSTPNLIALSVVKTEPYEAFIKVLKDKITDQQSKLYLDQMRNAVNVVGHGIRTTPVEKLDQTCKDLIADFDGGLLESNRKVWDQYQKTISK